MLLTERQIDLRLKCPMFDMEDRHGPSSYECAQKLLRWAVLDAFKGRLVPVALKAGEFSSGTIRGTMQMSPESHKGLMRAFGFTDEPKPVIVPEEDLFEDRTW